MDTAEVINLLEDNGIRLQIDGDRLIAGPADRLTDGLRALIRNSKPQIITLINAAKADTLAGYEAALQAGTLVACVQCRHFTNRPSRMPDGFCKLHREAVWGRIPFDCPEQRSEQVLAGECSER